ncbi:hypothetical protein AgCh_026935 [Apium graveolens]
MVRRSMLKIPMSWPPPKQVKYFQLSSVKYIEFGFMVSDEGTDNDEALPTNIASAPKLFSLIKLSHQALLEVLAALEENIAPTCCVWDAHNISTRIKQLGDYVNSSNKSSTSTSTSVAGKYQHFRTFGREMQRG